MTDEIKGTLPISAAAIANYEQMARDFAKAEGTEPKAELEKMVKGWEERLKTDAIGGWEHLIAWAKDHDPGWGEEGDAEKRELARARESALKDPGTAMVADPEVVDAAHAALQQRDKGHESVASSPLSATLTAGPDSDADAAGPESDADDQTAPDVASDDEDVSLESSTDSTDTPSQPTALTGTSSTE